MLWMCWKVFWSLLIGCWWKDLPWFSVATTNTTRATEDIRIVLLNICVMSPVRGSDGEGRFPLEKKWRRGNVSVWAAEEEVLGQLKQSEECRARSFCLIFTRDWYQVDVHANAHTCSCVQYKTLTLEDACQSYKGENILQGQTLSLYRKINCTERFCSIRNSLLPFA